jgi:hypothetical protein
MPTIKRKYIFIAGPALLAIFIFLFIKNPPYDFDGDSTIDSYKFGKGYLHIFWTDKKKSPLDLDESWKKLLDLDYREKARHDLDAMEEALHAQYLLKMLQNNDFSLSFINKKEPYEVNYLRNIARKTAMGASSDLEKSLKIMDWLFHYIIKEESNLIKGIDILAVKKAQCESNGAFIALMESIGIKGRFISASVNAIDTTPQGTELFTDGKWILYDPVENICYKKSALELQQSNKLSNINIVYYWRMPNGELRRKKLFYQPSLETIFATDKGLADLKWADFNLKDYKITQ